MLSLICPRSALIGITAVQTQKPETVEWHACVEDEGPVASPRLGPGQYLSGIRPLNLVVRRPALTSSIAAMRAQSFREPTLVSNSNQAAGIRAYRQMSAA